MENMYSSALGAPVRAVFKTSELGPEGAVDRLLSLAVATTGSDDDDKLVDDVTSSGRGGTPGDGAGVAAVGFPDDALFPVVPRNFCPLLLSKIKAMEARRERRNIVCNAESDKPASSYLLTRSLRTMRS